MEMTRNLAHIDKESSDEDFMSLCENLWTNKIVMMFFNLSQADKTHNLKSERLKKLLAEYNETHNW